MSKNSSRHSKSNVICNLFGHNYRMTRTVSDQIHEYKCSVCKREITEDIHGSIIELDSHYKQINDTLSFFIEKRTRRLAVQ